MSRKCQWFAVGAGLLTRPPSVDCDARRVRATRRAVSQGFALRASFFPSDGKETKGSPGRLTSPSGTSSPPPPVRSPRTPEFTGAQFRGLPVTVRRGKDNDCPATAPLPLSLSLQNQDGLDSWTKRARLIAQGLISAEGESAGGSGTPYGQFLSHAIRWPPQPQNHFCGAVLMKGPEIAVRAGPARPPSVDCDARRILRLTRRAAVQGFRPAGRVSFPAMERNQRIAGETQYRRRGGSGTRPSPIHGNGSVRRPPTRTLCHGWSEPGAVVKWCRPKFLRRTRAQWPGRNQHLEPYFAHRNFCGRV